MMRRAGVGCKRCWAANDAGVPNYLLRDHVQATDRMPRAARDFHDRTDGDAARRQLVGRSVAQ